MIFTLGPGETFHSGTFVLSQAAAATKLTVNWIVEPKFTGQEDLPPGFRGEVPTLEARRKDDSQPTQCQTVDPSALVCGTVRVSGFSMFNKTHHIFNRRAFDEIQGRAHFISENGEYLGFWCEKTTSWRLTNMQDEQDVRNGSCRALAASTGGVQFKDSVGWQEVKGEESIIF